ncbi:hypothetical protein [Streptomyces chattanoogensis]|uniref:hypothetical protein n=1 Tax=Streptomyces chattanoogensis TaxID=66876 RepID=UPI0036A992B3
MNKGLVRIAGVALMAAGIALAVWMVVGAPHLGFGLAKVVAHLVAWGAVFAGGGLAFWQRGSRTAEEATAEQS